MNQDIKKRWVDALRSGSYDQDKNLLATSDGYCCLGVLCEIAVQDGVVFKENGIYTSAEDHYDYSFEELPEAVQHWAGLSEMDYSENPLTDVEYTYTNSDIAIKRPADRKNAHLSELNDDMGYNFDQIADVIDRVF